jgi:hypothetical protein
MSLVRVNPLAGSTQNIIFERNLFRIVLFKPRSVASLIHSYWRDTISRVRPPSREGNEKGLSIFARSVDASYRSPGSMLD